ncbi:Major facilitator superfamily transporter [Pleurostoma richardsiae]|uniref:Major facilitator superfamily transporter n=1 Tax=Pleurostoma richardsiae TaxID=41990 RepID=A0AA38S4T0_9PEZI|nr:Major facilitator superfamily transporter [Pleurostoma richardsiae]
MGRTETQHPQMLMVAPNSQQVNNALSDSDVENQSPPASLKDEPPDGGRIAWEQVLVGHLVNAMTWGVANAYGVFQLYYKENTSWSASQISWIGSVQIFLMFVLGTVSGRLADGGYARHCILAGSILCTVGMFTTSVATAYWQIMLSLGVCQGTGSGLLSMPVTAIIGADFKRKRALALSISAAGTGVGAVAYTAVVQYLIPKVGFPWAVRCCGFITLFCGLVANALAEPRLPPRKRGGLIDMTALHDRPFVIFSAGSFLIYYSLFTVVIYINSFARNAIGFSDTDAGTVLLITSATSIIARPIAGFAADHYLGAINTYNLGTFVLSILIFAWIGVRDRTSTFIFSAIVGFVNGSAQGVFPGAISNLVDDLSKLGTRLGMVFALCGFATLAGPPTMGALLDKSGGDYLGAQIWGGTVMLTGSLIVATTRYFAKKDNRRLKF